MSATLPHCFFFFFFSSRRRHTRSLRDWSSDVCSSDLAPKIVSDLARSHCGPSPLRSQDQIAANAHKQRAKQSPSHEIGRASCRERVYISVVAVSLKKKKKKRQIERRRGITRQCTHIEA